MHSRRKSDKTATQRSQFKVDWLLFTRTNFLYVKFPGESIAHGYIHRKNRCPDSQHFFVLSWKNILLQSRKLNTVEQNKVFLCKKVRPIDQIFFETPQKSLWAHFTPNLDQYPIFFQYCSVIWEEAKCGQSKRGVLM